MRKLSSRFLTKSKKLSFFAGIGLALVGVLAVAGLSISKVSAADCDSNAIIYCGFSSRSSFVSKVRSNNSGNGHSDLKAVYAHYGLESADYDRFVSYARGGTAYRDGRIVVDGQTVATGTKSIGREAYDQGSGYFTTNIAGHNYYGNENSRNFATDALPVNVLFNARGVMQFAVLTSCGNPIYGSPVTPSYSCNSLRKTPVAGKANTYSFTTSASAASNASISKLVYTFGDGSTATTTNPATPVTHTYAKAGTFTAKVTVYVHLPGDQDVTVTNGGCQTVITVVMPYYQCVNLTGAILDKSKFSYSFVANLKYGNGASPTKAVFNFGDGNTTAVTKLSSTTTYATTHQYAKAGKYNISATLYFTSNGTPVTAPACTASVTPTTPPTPTCKPGVPVGSPECAPPCKYDSSLPPDSTQCVPTVPPELPNTGAGDVIAIFAAVVVGGFLIYRQLLFRKHKAAFVAAERGTSALPLGQPLDPNTPLDGTPLAQKRHGFRRRQF